MFYLAARPDQAVSRTRLIALLWEESDEPEGRNSLSTALSRLRRALPNAPVLPLGDSLAWRPDRHASACIRCETCDGYPCMIQAKSDAQVICVDPALKYPNVTLMTNAKVTKLTTSASGRVYPR